MDCLKLHVLLFEKNKFGQAENMIESKHQLAAGQIVNLEKVSMSMDDEEINDKLRKFTFTSTANTWRATTKLSAVIVPAEFLWSKLFM